MGPFVMSDFNRIGESFRSPYSNEYYPPVNVAKYPPEELRKFEISFGSLVKIYTKLYYSASAVSSVYTWDLGDSITNGFGVCVLICSSDDKIISTINSVNIFGIKFSTEVVKNKEYLKVYYKLQSTMSNVVSLDDSAGFNTSVSKSSEDSVYIPDYLDYDTHFERIGKLMESTENSLRVSLEEIFLNKVISIISSSKVSSEQSKRNYLLSMLIQEHKSPEEQQQQGGK